MSTQLDPHLLATLDPEERAAFEPDPDADADELRAIAGEDAYDGSDDDADDDSTEQKDAEALESTNAPGPAPVEGKGAKDVPPADDEAPAAAAPSEVASVYRADLPSDYDAQLQSIKDEDAALRQKFKDGEIDIDERDAGLAELSERREQLLVARAKAEISQEMTQQTTATQWQATINRAVSEFARPENGGIDYRKDPVKAQDWDQFVRVLAAKPEHSDKPMDWFLQEAHKRVMALHGVERKALSPRDAMADAKSKRKPPMDGAPLTLAQVPGSDGPGDVGDEFSDVMALDGLEFEQAIARMSPAQREKFMRGR